MVMEYAILDLYHLFVEVIFGHFLMAVIGLVGIFTVICSLMKMSQILIITIMTLFVFVMMVGYFGSIVGVFVFFFSLTFLAYSFIRWIQGWYVS